ncbi:o-succinylbenzoate synthase [Thermaurantimonas aggregans]|uniref:o-succinylbenzoate synthase n=1 Tax=Thermaurantimonas aggregans TaxID=2173829 RepID=A0A401XI75_9FLAO|nr:o-succinylbenzoate synthase [Thermaurantimonas aggregans]MCX8149304.1 o-succinylbenzoate synthase [Thermaurantimonas aggregans]GCD76701.1 o-succinylbenzoate synthase [Thermaurantimonas aggregans]
MKTLRILPHTLKFKFEARTSRGSMTERHVWYIVLEEEGFYGIGEAAPIPGLSIDDMTKWDAKLRWLEEHINDDPKKIKTSLKNFPALYFGFEMAMHSLDCDHPMMLYPSVFTTGRAGIPINGLVWMNDAAHMQAQIDELLEQGFTVLKMKVGALDWKEEFKIIKELRKKYDNTEVQLRLDANGAWQPEEALEKLNKLSEYEIHSIEQPIKPGQWEQMAHLCAESPIPIALDEELIGISDLKQKKDLIKTISPDYLIIKPTLLGGFKSSEEWIKLAKENGIDWWVTSALESNIGLNAISQWVVTQIPRLPQGLGTGMLYENNIYSPLEVRKGKLIINTAKSWDVSQFGIENH